MATFTNMASLSFNGNTIYSNLVTGELADTLTVTKTAVTDEYTADGVITYAVSILNSDSAAATGLTLTDDLGGYPFDAGTVYPLSYVDGSVQYFSDGVLQPAPTVASVQPLVISGISVPAGGNAMIMYEAQVSEFAPLEPGSQIVNTVTVTGASVSEELTASETVTVSAQPELSIVKEVSPDAVTRSQAITYTFTIRNVGNAAVTAADAVTLTDLFNPIVDISSVSFNGTAWQSPANYTMDTATGEFSSVAGQITVPAATYTQNPDTGAWEITPGVSVLTVTGTI